MPQSFDGRPPRRLSARKYYLPAEPSAPTTTTARADIPRGVERTGPIDVRRDDVRARRARERRGRSPGPSPRERFPASRRAPPRVPARRRRLTRFRDRGANR
eukprot:23092-Pelagococcus_subviridis.AAC.1